MRSMNVLMTTALIAGGVVVAGPARADEFQGLGFPSGGGNYSEAKGVSADGTVAVGYADFGGYSYEAFRWTLTDGMVGLGILPGGSFSVAYATSADGSVVVGESDSTSSTLQAFRWTQADGMVGLGFFSGGDRSAAYATSADGSVVVGESNQTGGDSEAFRWTQADGMVHLGFLAGSNYSVALGVSADGSVVVGNSAGSIPQQAFRWTQADGMVGLGFLPGGTTSSATAISADGLVVVGFGQTGASAPEAFRWTQADGMVGLGYLSGATASFALAVSADGAVVVGYSDSHAFFWTQADGIQSVADTLTGNGVNLGAWELNDAQGVSADGTVIVGRGTDPSGDTEAWIAVLDVGLVSVDDFAGSLASTGAAAGQSFGEAQGGINTIMDIARHFGQSGFGNVQTAAADTGILSDAGPGHPVRRGRRAGETHLWGVFSGDQYDGDVADADGAQADLGFSYQVSEAWRVGAGARVHGTTDGELPVYDGAVRRRTDGLAAFIAYEPESSGLRFYAGVQALSARSDITRVYLNGVTPVTSEGRRHEHSYSGGVELGYEFGVYDNTGVMPFVRYDVMRTKLDAYTEQDGPFPAAFDEVSYNFNVLRLGAELNTRLSPHLELWASGDWAHRSSDRLPDITGAVSPLGAFALPGAEVQSDWAEGHVGLGWRLSPRMTLRASAGLTSDGDTAPNLSGGIGFDMRL